MEGCVHGRVQVMPAELAGISPLRLDAIPFGLTLALWALVTLAKLAFKDVLQACLVIWELSKKLTDCQGIILFALTFLRSHGWRMPESNRMSRG